MNPKDPTPSPVPTAARCIALVQDAQKAWQIAPGHVRSMAAPILVPTLMAMEAMAAKLEELESKIEAVTERVVS